MRFRPKNVLGIEWVLIGLLILAAVYTCQNMGAPV